MSEQWWWKAEPPPNGNEGNPWFVRDGVGNVQAIISHTVPGIDEKTAKYIAALGTSCAGHERRADQAEAMLAVVEAENEALRSVMEGASQTVFAVMRLFPEDHAITVELWRIVVAMRMMLDPALATVPDATGGSAEEGDPHVDD